VSQRWKQRPEGSTWGDFAPAISGTAVTTAASSISRAGDALRLGGFQFNPAEIEAHLQAHAAVDGCQVIGAETARGTAAVAFVTLHPSAAAGEAALREHCRGALVAFKVPARVFVIENSPRPRESEWHQDPAHQAARDGAALAA
jgi:acyl-CoA synthetase (AMP-forming)/AMP-acid ligase II